MCSDKNINILTINVIIIWTKNITFSRGRQILIQWVGSAKTGKREDNGVGGGAHCIK